MLSFLVACPFFYATHCHSNWMSQRPVPLGDVYAGECRARAESYVPGEEQLTLCNLGYARDECSRFPAAAVADQTRFCLTEAPPDRVVVRWVQERAHLPLESGAVEFDLERQVWLAAHPDPVIQRQAEAYLEAYLRRCPVELRKQAHG